MPVLALVTLVLSAEEAPLPCATSNLDDSAGANRWYPETTMAGVSEDGDDWCGTSHPGQALFSDSSPDELNDANVDGWNEYLPSINWRNDVSSSNNGWRFCGLTFAQCTQACVALAAHYVEGGKCEEMMVTDANGCCFPAYTECNGNKRPTDPKYLDISSCDVRPTFDQGDDDDGIYLDNITGAHVAAIVACSVFGLILVGLLVLLAGKRGKAKTRGVSPASNTPTVTSATAPEDA